MCCNGLREFGYSRYGKLEIIRVFSTETACKSGTVRKLRYSSFRRYPLGGAVFCVACTSARLIHCIADSGKPGAGIRASSSAVPVDRDLALKVFNYKQDASKLSAPRHT